MEYVETRRRCSPLYGNREGSGESHFTNVIFPTAVIPAKLTLYI